MRRRIWTRPVLVPLLVFVILSTGFSFIWYQEQYHDAEVQRARSRVAADQAAARIAEAIRTRLELVDGLRREWQLREFPSREVFERRVLSIQERFPGYQAINWIDPQGVIRWVVPRDSNLPAENRDLHEHPFARDTFVRAEQTGQVQVTSPIELFQGGLGLASYFPIDVGARRLGYINGVFRLRPLVEAVLHSTVLESYEVRLIAGEHELAFNPAGSDVRGSRLSATAPVPLAGQSWQLVAGPAAAAGTEFRGMLTATMLTLGLALAAVAAYLVRLDLLRRAELVRSERKYRSLFEESLDVVYISTPEGRIVDINEAGVRLFGARSREELLSLDIARDLFVDPAERRQIVTALQERGFVQDAPLRLKRLDGLPIQARASAVAVRDGRERVVAYRGILRDETERVRMQQQITRMQRMESMSHLAGGVAHDFNNVLGAILANASLLEHRLDDPDALRYLDQIENSVKSASRLTSQLLSFSRGELRRAEPLDLNRVTEDTLEILERTIDPRIRIEKALAPGLPWVEGDRGQLQQVLLNLLVNARDAMPDGGVMTLTTRATDPPPHDPQSDGTRPGSAAGPWALLEVSDTGPGIDAKNLERIFEPFYTSKERGKGTGLGLAVAFGIVTGHGGRIRVDSRPGRGATFTILLPPTSRRPESRTRVEAAERRSGGTILVVDDDPAVRRPIAELLGSRGYRVLQAADGEEAVKTYRERGGEIDLVLLDMTMPRLSGADTFGKLSEIDPAVRVVLCSGYSADHWREKLSHVRPAGFLQKPFRLDDLQRVVSEAINPG